MVVYIKIPATLIGVNNLMRSERKLRNLFIDTLMIANEVNINKILNNISINHRH